MSIGDFDIESEKERLLSSDKWFEVENLEPSRSTFHKRGSSLLICCNLQGGIRIVSDATVIVQGWVNGSDKSRCNITAKGDVIVEGNVHYAHIEGRNIRIGGEAKRCVLSAAEAIEVGAEVSGAKITVGDFEEEKRNLATCWQELQRLRKSNEYNERQYSIEQKRVPRQIEKTRFKLDYSIGNVVRHWVVQQTSKQIDINLAPLYRVLAGKSEKEIDLGLKEFFTSGIVTTLMRANQHLIDVNQNRQIVFMGAIQHLQELFWLARTIDKQKVGIAQEERRFNILVEETEAFSAELFTRGPVLPNVNIEFRHPIVDHHPDEKAIITEDRATYSLRIGRATSSWSVEQTSTQGEIRNREVNPAALQAVKFELEAGWLGGSEMVEQNG